MFIWAGDVAQLMECLSSLFKALGWIPSTANYVNLEAWNVCSLAGRVLAFNE